MPSNRKGISAWKKIGIGLLVFMVLLVVGYRIFIARYLPPLIRQRLNDLIVKGSDSLYKFEMGKISVSPWGNSISFTNLHIYIDSAKYQKLKENKRLPALTFDLDLPQGRIKDVGILAMIFRKKLKIERIDVTDAAIQLSRHFRTAKNKVDTTEKPLWQVIQPTLRSIAVKDVIFRNIKINYNNADSATSFRWQFDKCYATFSGILIDSLSANDTSRVLYSSNVTLTAQDVKMKTPDGLYGINSSSIFYASAGRMLEAKQFSFVPMVENAEFNRHFGFQHEIYTLNIPVIKLHNFPLWRWITYNELIIDTAELQSPDIGVYLDRNAAPNPYSKLGKYPQQLLQKAPFLIRIKRLTVGNGTVTYREKNDKNKLTGKVVFPGLHGYIDNIINDSADVAQTPQCIANVNGGVLQTGILNAVFRFNLADRSGGFNVTASIAKLNADQLGPLIKAMTSAEMQSFNLQRLDYSITANEISGTAKLRMKYTDMDILLNTVNEDGSLNKKGFLSFFINHLLIYKENPTKDDEERVADGVSVQRDVTRSFFNFIWKSLYSSAGKIVLRPMVQRKLEKRKRNTK